MAVGSNGMCEEACGAVVSLFPVNRRLGLVRTSAAELAVRHGNDAVLFWRTECRRLADELWRLGYDEDAVRREVFAFQDQVQAELMRIHETGHPSVA